MLSLLRANIDKRVHLTDEEFKVAATYFVPKTIKKHQFFLNEGDVCKYLGFVSSGCLREYTIDSNGGEHIIQFAIEDWWIADLNSFLSGLPSTHNIDALEDSQVLLLEKSRREQLLDECSKMDRFFRILLEANYVTTHQRVADSLSLSAEQQYLKFTKTYPKLLERIPQNQIAAYLGITPQSLSRIRREITPK